MMAQESSAYNPTPRLKDAKSEEEDWTKLSDVENRRKMQNRLNQRARRRRQLEQKRSKGEDNAIRKGVMYVEEQSKSKCSSASSKAPPFHSQSLNSAQLKFRLGFLICQLTTAECSSLLEQLENLVGRYLARHQLDGELLVPIMQLNIVRAMMSNAAHFGLTPELLHQDIPSPFNITGPLAINVANLPPSLQPTSLQKEITHHPWIDLFPLPSIRDAVLRRMAEYDDEELCHNLFMEVDGADTKSIGLVVWGEPWDPTGYEISSGILRKWPWFIQDCPDLIHSSNYWRRRRAERPLCTFTAADNTM
ncbi:hypothetical protein VHEMI04529 [[Torrubiella] hemipterigena]|uniref:BZIP domain-containing protein n=1 Tax=[Torrubiella] hemipterigena TaxID=1531966 RepID=A0A0A1TE49_9HYPO|nr:hypothetical protein VHEMI04529 [[Torrubiella] hemipterigena]